MLAKVIIALSAVFATANATAIMARPIASTGVSTSTRTQDSLGNYAFAYDIVDQNGATNSRSEVGDAAGNKKGSYSLSDIDGRARRVDYIADADGFKASVKTNEPGTALSNPANAEIISPYAAPAAPVAPIIAPPVVRTTKILAPAVPIFAAPAPIKSFTTVFGYPAAIPVPLALQIYKPATGKSLIL